MPYTRRRLLAATGAVTLGSLAGCSGQSTAREDTVAQSTFFVFGDIAAQVAGDAAAADLLVPIGQHGHGWEPGPRVRGAIRDADLLVHGMESFQPWVDDIRGDLDADGADVATVDVTAGLDLLEANASHDDEHEDEEGHDDEHEADDHGTMDPHFWMDPRRVRDAVGPVQQAFADIDGDNAAAFADNAEAYRERLTDLDERIEATVADGSRDALLVAGHDSFGYLGDRYDLEIHALTDVSPDDRPTARDIERAQELIATNDIRYICADPLESQQAAEQLVAETDAEGVLPLTAMPGLTEEWDAADWGYVEVMDEVNRPTLAEALDA